MHGGSVHGGSFNNLPILGADTRSLLERFEALWNDRRYTRRLTPLEANLRRQACEQFHVEANAILAAVLDTELPKGVRRNTLGSISSSDIVKHVDIFRTVLARLDAE